MQVYPRITEAQYKKLVFQLRTQFMAILNVFRCYGMQSDVDGAIEECVKLAENFGMTIRGKNSPIHVRRHPKGRSTDGK